MKPARTRCRSRPSVSHSGFSLLEVIIATAILMGSAVVLSRLAGMGREQAVRARIHADAQQICEHTLNELLLGIRIVEPVELAPLLPVVVQLPPRAEGELSDEQFSLSIPEPGTMPQEVDEADPVWRYSVRIDPLPDLPGLWNLTVFVVQGDLSLERPVRFALTRWLPGPVVAGDQLPVSSDLDGVSDGGRFGESGLNGFRGAFP